MKMKPLPKGILIAIVVVGVGYGANSYFDGKVFNQTLPLPKTAPVAVQEDKAPPAKPSVVANVPQTEAPVSAPATSSVDAGLDSVLKAAASKQK